MTVPSNASKVENLKNLQTPESLESPRARITDARQRGFSYVVIPTISGGSVIALKIKCTRTTN